MDRAHNPRTLSEKEAEAILLDVLRHASRRLDQGVPMDEPEDEDGERVNLEDLLAGTRAGAYLEALREFGQELRDNGSS